MKEYKSIIITCIAGICAVICVVIGTNGLKEAKLGKTGEDVVEYEEIQIGRAHV